MKRIVLLILLVVPIIASAQRMEIYTYNSFKYIALYAYGLQRDVVKSNSEMRESQFNGDGTGIMKRHHTTKGFNKAIGNKGYDCNSKITFAFMVAPYNIDKDGNHVHTDEDVVTWAEASGWDTSMNDGSSESYDLVTGVGIGESTVAPTPTGCAAYKGMNGTDKPGEWRLPTQREIQVMFTVIEQTLGYIVSEEVEHEIIEGLYWTSSEFFDAGSKGWAISSITGRPQIETKSNKHMVRCVKDIYEPINE